MYVSSQRSEFYIVRSGNVKISILPKILPLTQTLNVFFTCLVICFLIFLPKAHAGEKQIPVFLAPALETSRIDSLFTREIEGAFIDLGVYLTDIRAILSSYSK